MQDITIEPKMLVMVSTANNNKVYRMIPHENTFDVEFGRVGANFQHASYPISQWNKKYKEKIKKGYVDQTHLMQDLIEKEDKKDGYKEIENMVISEIVQRLQDMARKKISANYRVSSQQVTQAMVDEAQKTIDELMNKEYVEDFNNTLLKLFTIIPRKMSDVKSYMAKDTISFARIIKEEQDLLDVMRGQVVTHLAVENPIENTTESQVTILDAMGLEFEEVNDDDIEKIKNLLGECRDKFYRAWKVKNIKTQKRFDEFVEKEKISEIKLLWHGSRNENWWSIINTGLVLRPTNAVITGKMFGYGIYYAPKAKKSLGYTSINGSYWAKGNSKSAFMAVMDVAYGKPYDVHSFDKKYYNFNYEVLQKTCPGANCLHAHAGKMLQNDEIIVYKEEQCTIKYLVELR